MSWALCCLGVHAAGVVHTKMFFHDLWIYGVTVFNAETNDYRCTRGILHIFHDPTEKHQKFHLNYWTALETRN